MLAYYRTNAGFAIDEDAVFETMRTWYDNYRFSPDTVVDADATERVPPQVANPTLVLNFMQYFLRNRKPPRELVDENLRTDYMKIRRLSFQQSNNSTIQQFSLRPAHPPRDRLPRHGTRALRGGMTGSFSPFALERGTLPSEMCYNIGMKSERAIPYGVTDFKTIRGENYYYVDKTTFIAPMERRDRFIFFVRPRRFGKSLLIDTLRCYYDVAEKENFQKLFGDLAVGRDPTPGANKYWVLTLNFSKVCSPTSAGLESEFLLYMTARLGAFVRQYAESFPPEFVAEVDKLPPKQVYQRIVEVAATPKGHPLYILIDEYDNFTNTLVASEGKLPYQEITHKAGFYRGWFKLFKDNCSRLFMTGVSPVTMDDLTSGFNIATNISQKAEFNAMVGFTADETRKLYEDFLGAGSVVEGHLQCVKDWYDGYCFSARKVGVEAVYNSDMALYYLSAIVKDGCPPETMADANIRSDWSKLKMILRAQRDAETAEGTLPMTEELAETGETTFRLVDSFPVEDLVKPVNFKSLYYYYGIVTMGAVRHGTVSFRVPNECVRRQVFEYMRGEYERRGHVVDFEEYVRLFDAMAWDGAWRPFFTYLAEQYKAYGSVRDALNVEAHLNGFLRSYLTMKGGYMVKPEIEQGGGFCDYAFFPDRSLDDVSRPTVSYVVELKHAKSDATDAQLAALHQAALDQLKKYSEDPNLPALAGGTPVHYLCYEFKGRDLFRLEEVDPATGAKIA